jgi:hypothetical protein
MEEGPTIIEVTGDPTLAKPALEPMCGYVVNLILLDGTALSGVLLGVNSTALILDRWDQDTHRPASDPLVVDLCLLESITIP